MLKIDEFLFFFEKYLQSHLALATEFQSGRGHRPAPSCASLARGYPRVRPTVLLAHVIGSEAER